MKTLERRLEDTLRHEAERLPGEEVVHTLTPIGPNRRGFLRPGVAAPAAVVAVMILAAPVIWLTAERGGDGATPDTPPTSQAVTTETSQSTATTTPDTAPMFDGLLGAVVDQLPDAFDLEQASPIFVMDADLEATALRYLETRHLTTDVGLSRVEEQDGYTLVQWAWGRLLDDTEPEQGETGWLVMRPTSDGYEVLAATTDGIDLSQVTISGNGHILGGVASNTDQIVGVDVLNLDETPVDSAPNPEGMPDADYLWGTAASGNPPLGIDVQVSGPAFLRVNRVGGALLSISEVILGDDIESRVAEDGQAQVEEIPEPTAEDWTALPGGLSVAVVEEANGGSRIWTKSAVQGPTAAASTDIAFTLVPVSATELAVLTANPEFFGLPMFPGTELGGDEDTAEGLPETARIHWFEGSDAVDTVNIDWDSDPRFGIAFVEARDANILDVEYATDP